MVNKLSDHHYTGTGDVTCALLLAWIHRLGAAGAEAYVYGTALLNAISSVQAMLARAQFNANSNPDQLSCRSVELPIIQSKLDIESPPVQRLVETNNCNDVSDLYHLWTVKI